MNRPDTRRIEVETRADRARARAGSQQQPFCASATIFGQAVHAVVDATRRRRRARRPTCATRGFADARVRDIAPSLEDVFVDAHREAARRADRGAEDAVKPALRIWSSFVADLPQGVPPHPRDRGTLMIALTIPIFQLILFGFIDQTVHERADGRRRSGRHAREPRARWTSCARRGPSRSRASPPNPRDARDEITAGRARVGVVIPPDYHDKRARGDGREGPRPHRRLRLDRERAGARRGQRARRQREPRGDRREARRSGRARRSPRSRSSSSTPTAAPRTTSSRASSRSCCRSSRSCSPRSPIVREREQGTLEQLLVTPINPLGLDARQARALPRSSASSRWRVHPRRRCASASACRSAAACSSSSRWRSSTCSRSSSIGLFISTRAQTQAQAQQMAQFFFLPSIFLSRLHLPDRGPAARRSTSIGRVLPATHMIEIMRGVVLRDAGPRELLPNVAGAARDQRRARVGERAALPEGRAVTL